MQNKTNINRVLLGGIIAGIVLDLLSTLIHGVILGNHYKYFMTVGSVLPMSQDRMLPLQIAFTVLSGIPLAFLYVIGRNHFGPGPKCAIIVGMLAGLMSLPYCMAEYTFYNMGEMIPAMSFVNNFAGAIIGTYIAGLLYKDKAEKAV